MPTLKRRSWMLALILLLALPFMADSCESSGPSQQAVDQNNNNSQRAALTAKYPFPKITNSEELANITERYKRLNDPQHVSYIYLLSNTGEFIAEYQVIGKCSSTESQYSAPANVLWNSGGTNGNAGVTVPAPQPDGSYGQNENALYCFLDDAQHTMVEFTTQFIWSDAPLPLKQPPAIVLVSNGK